MAPRVTHPLADGGWKMRTPVGGNNADIVYHLDDDHHVSGALHDLVVVVVTTWNHRRTGDRPEDAAVGEGTILGSIGGMEALRFRTGSGALLAIGSEGGDSSIGRI